MYKDESARKVQLNGRVAFLVMGFALLMIPHTFANSALCVAEPGPQQTVPGSRPKKTTKRATAQKARINYSRFSHNTHVAQQKLECDSCHKFPTKNWNEVRKGDTAFPDAAEFPEHSACLDCHRPQFFARERPAPAICSNCHMKATPRDTTRFLFPSLGDISDPLKPKPNIVTEFAINFPHDKHIDVVGFNTPIHPRSRAGFIAVLWQQGTNSANSAEPKSCSVCHQTYQPQGSSDEEYVTKPPKNIGDAFWLKKGAFKTIPNSHTVCFTCHNTDAGIAPAPSECSACHKLGTSQALLKTDFDPILAETIGVTDKTILTTWSRRISSGAFRHEGGEHPNVSCIKCHNVPTMNTVDLKTLAVPVGSCGGAEGCHVTATTDDGGAMNYEIDQKKTNPVFVCTKCHINFGREVVPKSHMEAITTPSPTGKSSL